MWAALSSVAVMDSRPRYTKAHLRGRHGVNFLREPNPVLSTGNFIIPPKASTALSIRSPGENELQMAHKKNRTPITPPSLPQTQSPPPSPSAQQDQRQLSSKKTRTAQIFLDIYANNYIPLWLRAVNESYADLRPCLPLNSINFTSYVSSFAGSSILSPPQPLKLPPSSLVFPPSTALSPENYGDFFADRLQNELIAQAAQLTTFNLYDFQLEVENTHAQLFRLSVPGIRESSPRIDLGDIVLVRPLLQDPERQGGVNTATFNNSAVRAPRLIVPVFSGVEYQAIVWGVSNIKEYVVLRMDGFSSASYRRCNVTFVVQEHKVMPLIRSVDTVAGILSAEREDSWAKSILFPEPSDGKMQTTLSRGVFDFDWFDKALNHEQQKAVNSIVQGSYGRVPYLISGPPGTGKTKTIVEATLQLIRSVNNAHLLVCAPSDSAADTLASRLSQNMTPKQLFRLNGWTRSFAEVPANLLPYCFTINDLFSLPSFETILSFAVIVTTCRDANLLVQAQLTNGALTYLAMRMTAALLPSATTAASNSLHWTGLLLDEAAQATEPEALIPLSVITPLHESRQIPGPLFVAAGDEHQLGPRLTYRSPNSDLQVSLFERLFKREFYASHPLARSKGLQPLRAGMLPMPYPAFTNLIRNYRSHPAILSTSSALFYHDTLTTERAPVSDLVGSWGKWKSWPVLFRQNSCSDRVESILAGNGTGAGGLLNAGEVEIALEYAQSLLDHHFDTAPSLGAEEIMIMSPYRAQVKALRGRFREAGLHGVNIGPLEAFQGLESRIVILCTTRARIGPKDNPGRFIIEDRANGLGVIDEPKRFNVAITRAMEGLIVIGNSKCLTCTGDPAWTAFLQFCNRNGCLDGVKELNIAQSAILPVGRLEMALKYATYSETRGSESGRTLRLGDRVLQGTLPTGDEEMWMKGMEMEEEQAFAEGEEGEQMTDDLRSESGRVSESEPGPATTT